MERKRLRLGPARRPLRAAPRVDQVHKDRPEPSQGFGAAAQVAYGALLSASHRSQGALPPHPTDGEELPAPIFGGGAPRGGGVGGGPPAAAGCTKN